MDANNKQSKVTLATLLVALGIIYGDIGTSPLYVLSAIVGDRPIDEMLVYGGVSLIFWTFTSADSCWTITSYFHCWTVRSGYSILYHACSLTLSDVVRVSSFHMFHLVLRSSVLAHQAWTVL